MKKLLLLSAFFALLFSSCKDKNAYTIVGTLNDTSYNGKMVYLQKIASSSDPNVRPEILDSAQVKDGKYKFEGIAGEKPEMRFVSIGKLIEIFEPDPNKPVIFTMVLEPGDIKIDVTNSVLSIKGTPLNDQFNKLHVGTNEMAKVFDDADAGTLSQEAAREKLNKLQTEVEALSYNFTKENMANPVGEFLFLQSAGNLDMKQIKELIALASDSFKNNTEVKTISDGIKIHEKLQNAVNNKSIQLTDKSGNLVALSDVIGKGKVVIIDFWASGNPLCIEDIPNLKSLYGNYKDAGLEMVSISTDTDKAKWLDTVNKQGMEWMQFSDLDGTVTQEFGISQVPFSILVDGKGDIQAIALRGLELEMAINHFLSK